jgi:radical SAM protein (TIGR01212 family)
MYYRSFSRYLKERFGQKVFRISLDAGFTCPNRDGTAGLEGCAFCSPAGSWTSSRVRPALSEQIKRGKEAIKRRYGARKYLAYFQAYSNTYGSVDTLESVYESVVTGDEDCVGIVVGTRPDCIDDDRLKLVASYRSKGLEVWIEYGLQSSKDTTLNLIRRGHTVKDFSRAVLKSKEHGILISAHVIFGLPGEQRDDVIKTAGFLNGLPIDGVKLHNLNILRGTRIADLYYRALLNPLSLENYADQVVDFLERIDPKVIVARLVAESESSCLIAPRWSLDKQHALDTIHGTFRKRMSFQGKYH